MAHKMLDTNVMVLVKQLAPQYADKVAGSGLETKTFREALKTSNWFIRNMAMSMMGSYLPKGVTTADIEKAVNQPPPPPEVAAPAAKPVAPAPAPPATIAPVAGKPTVSTTVAAPAVPPKPAVAAPPPVAGAPAAAPAEAPPPAAAAVAAATAAPPTPLPQSRPAAAGPAAAGSAAAPAEGATGPWLDYLNSHGAHASVVKDGKVVSVPLGTPGQYNNIDPAFGHRLSRAAQAYKAQTGMEPRFGEGSRGNDVQAVHYKNLEGGRLGPVAHPADATHKGSNHLQGEADDIPKGPFLNWMRANAFRYGLAFPVKNDSGHVEMARDIPRQTPYAGDGTAAPAAGAPAAGAPAAGAPAAAAAPAPGAPNAANLSKAGAFPPGTSPEVIAAITGLSNKYGISPQALTGIIQTESQWNQGATSPGGKYRGLTQIGRETFDESGGKLGGMSYDEYLKASPDKQIEAYGAWLDHYKFADKALEKHIDFSTMSPARQAAYLQAFQFSPGNSSWIGGDDRTPVTMHKQAEGLGTTSLADMTAYYEKMFGDGAGAAAPATTTPADTPAATPDHPMPTADASKSLSGGMGGFGDALEKMAGNMYGGGRSGTQTASGPTTIPMVHLPTPPGAQPIANPKMIEMQRQQLAQAMQRLNSGKLF
jgi:hypothetical protein